MHKSFLFIIVFLSTTFVFAQEYESIKKFNKHISIVENDGLSGVLYKKELKIPVKYSMIDAYSDGIYLYDDTLIGFANSEADIIVPVEYKFVEMINSNFIEAIKNGETGAFNYEGEVIIPFADQKIEYFWEAVVVVKGEQSALYGNDGTVIVPMDDHKIEVQDDYGEVYTITKDDFTYYEIQEDMYILDDYLPVTKRLFAKNGEVSMRDYFAFVEYQKQNRIQDVSYTELLPDLTKVEPKLLGAYENFKSEILKVEGYSFIEYVLKKGKEKVTLDIPFAKNKEQQKMLDFPVTGVTKQQAEYYVKWLTYLNDEYLYDNWYDYKVNYRLPSEQEWIEIAENGLPEEMKKNHVLDSVNSKGCMLYIYNNLPKCTGYDDYLKYSLGGGSAKILSMNANYDGIYQMFGNVAEMTSEDGIAKGGSYHHSAPSARTDQQQTYSGPKPWLGFRVVAELVLE